MGANLLEQRTAVAILVPISIAIPVAIPAAGFCRLIARCDQLPFGRGEHPLKTHDQQGADQVRMDVLGPTTDEFLLESRDTVADGGLDFTLRLHGQASRLLLFGPWWDSRR